VWIQAKQMVGLTTSRWVQWACLVFNKAEIIWQLKWRPVTHFASNWQPTSLVCEVSHIITNFD